MLNRLLTVYALCVMVYIPLLRGQAAPASNLETIFANPPADAHPWVFWFWINGNISRDGITKDLEAMKRVGINGVLWMEVSGPWWAPQGQVEAGTEDWDNAMQWAISEADRLGMTVDLSVDFGYGSGGPHIRPDTSMQKLMWSVTPVKGGSSVSLTLEKPTVDYEPMLKKVWLRPGEQLDPEFVKRLEDIDSYRDIAVFAVKSSKAKESLIENLKKLDGRGWQTHLPAIDGEKTPALKFKEDLIDLTGQMGEQGKLDWSPPEGNWLVIRLGHASNFQMTRPCPSAAVGLECDRLNAQGMDAHFEHHLKPILEAAGDKAGRTLRYIHIDSWEARGQNWSAGFSKEFKKRRGYDIRPWLPVLTGYVVQNAEMTERFLWDMRQTVSELMLENYIDRLRKLSAPYGVKFSCESYGDFCVDDLTYGGRSDFPIAEFWTEKQFVKATDLPPDTFGNFRNPAEMNRYCYSTMKGLASVANTYGKPRVGAEAFTGSRGWVDHPWLIKGMGDEAFALGINHYIYHLSAHQPYDNMVPGLTHRKWGQHFQRHQTWWEFSKPYFDYVIRSQTLLRQGRTITDFACLYQEGAPLSFHDDIKFDCPPGFDYDLCSPEIVQRMEFKDGHIQLPSGARYCYLVLPKTGRLTLRTATEIEALRKAGASIYKQSEIVGTPGLEGYPESDETVRKLAKQWPQLPNGNWNDILTQDKLKPDFEGGAIRWLHRRIPGADIYFVANTTYQPVRQKCLFRVRNRLPEIWNPETGERYKLAHKQQPDGRIAATIKFDPAQSWFVVFREHSTATGTHPFPSFNRILEIKGPWHLRFDPAWGRKEPLALDTLSSWTENADPLVKYYSGKAVYRKQFEFAGPSARPVYLDLGKVEVMAKVILNGRDCGITWKFPYRLEITDALQQGQNELEIHVVNTWVNRLVGDEQLPLDSEWVNWETLKEWPQWFLEGKPSPAGRYTFTSARHYKKDSPLQPSGLLGPVTVMEEKE